MITAWQIYWVMQLDSIGCFVFAAFVISLVCGGCAFLFAAIHAGDDHWSWNCDRIGQRQDFRRTLYRWGRLAIAASLVCGLAAALIPSTKTAAAMIVIPAVANNEAIQHEAGDLYGIAKDALRELARPKPAEKSE